jgi:hypothetical protein
VARHRFVTARLDSPAFAFIRYVVIPKRLTARDLLFAVVFVAAAFPAVFQAGADALCRQGGPISCRPFLLRCHSEPVHREEPAFAFLLFCRSRFLALSGAEGSPRPPFHNPPRLTWHEEVWTASEPACGGLGQRESQERGCCAARRPGKRLHETTGRPLAFPLSGSHDSKKRTFRWHVRTGPIRARESGGPPGWRCFVPRRGHRCPRPHCETNVGTAAGIFGKTSLLLPRCHRSRSPG